MANEPQKNLKNWLFFTSSLFLAAALLAAAFPESGFAARKPRPAPVGRHDTITVYEGSKTCNACHANKAQEVYASEHYQWKGKLGAINDFCTYPDANWLFQYTDGLGKSAVGGCATCHVGFGDTKPPAVGAKFSATPTQAQLAKIDCLMCHSDTYNHTGTVVNGQVVLAPDANSQANMATILANIKRTPSKQACLKCHAKAGGGDGVKQGDLDLSMANPPHDLDVHMASTALGGAGFTCVSCHTATKHKIAGKGSDLRVADGSGMKTCTTCHGSSPHDSGNLNEHAAQRAECTSCHVYNFARGPVATEARRDFTNLVLIGNRYEAIRTEALDVAPKYLRSDGASFFTALGSPLSKMVSEGGLQRYLVAGPNSLVTGSSSGKYRPFKVHTAFMGVDANRALLPLDSSMLWGQHLVRSAVTGAAPATFVETVRYLEVYHQVAPKEMAQNACSQCHGQVGD